MASASKGRSADVPMEKGQRSMASFMRKTASAPPSPVFDEEVDGIATADEEMPMSFDDTLERELAVASADAAMTHASGLCEDMAPMSADVKDRPTSRMAPMSADGEEQAGQTVLALMPGCMNSMLSSARPTCIKCWNELDPLRAQLKSKCGGRFVCNSCNTKQTLLTRALGTWPTPEFKELGEAEQAEFWKRAATAKNQEQLKMTLIDTLVTRRVDRVTARVSGTYLPLSVYATQGFDTSLIVERCTDVKEHAVLGKTYRLALCSLSRDAVEEKQREQVMSMLQKLKADKSSTVDDVVAAPTDGTTKKKNKCTDDSGDNIEATSDSHSDSSGTSSSSSSRGRKHKKHRSH